jgi:hypothetical protein
VSRAGTSTGTPRRRLVEIGQLEQQARRQGPELPRRQLRKLVTDYHARIVKGEAISA